MPKFTLNASVTVSARTIVEANTFEEAIEEAASRDVILSPYGPDRDGYDPSEVWAIEEADGMPGEIKEVETECPSD